MLQSCNSFGIERLHSVYMKRFRMIYIDKALVLYALRRLKNNNFNEITEIIYLCKGTY